MDTNTNVQSVMVQRNLLTTSNELSRTMQRLSSGYRINRAGDDAAGLQISHYLRAQLRGIDKAMANTGDGDSLVNVAEGAMGNISDNLQRVRELAIQAGNDTNGTLSRAAIQQEITVLMDDCDRIARSTMFNGVPLLTSATPSNYYLQIGQNAIASVDRINIGPILGNMTTSMSLSLRNLVWSMGTNSASNSFVGRVDAALSKINTRRASIGAVQNRLDSARANLGIQKVAVSSTDSRIRDADIAQEMSTLSRVQILQSSGISILSQANNNPGVALQLLQG